MKALNIRTTIFFCLAGMVVIHLAVLWYARQTMRKGYPDFNIYYCAGTMVRQGLGHELYNDVAQFNVQRRFSPEVATRPGALPYNHPPFEAAFFAPLTYMSYPAAFIFWDLLNLAMLMALPYLLRPHLPSLQDFSWPLWILASLAFFPIFFALLQGQDSILLLFLYTLGFVDLVKGNDTRAGGWLGLGLFKPQLVMPFILLMFLCGRRKMLYGFLPVAAVLGLLSAAIVGWQGLTSYPQYVLHWEASMTRGAIVPADMPNLRGVLYLLLVGGAHVDVATVTLSVCIFLFTVWQGRKIGPVKTGMVKIGSASLFPWLFALAVVTTVIVSYHSLAYDLSILVLPILLVVGEGRSAGSVREWPGWVTNLAIAVLFFSPLQLFLLLRSNRLALVGWAVLLWMAGIAGQISARTQGGLSPSTP